MDFQENDYTLFEWDPQFLAKKNCSFIPLIILVDITEAVDTVLDKVSEYDVTVVTLQETVSTLGNTLDTVQGDYMFVETKALEMDIRITENHWQSLPIWKKSKQVILVFYSKIVKTVKILKYYKV